MTTSIRRIFITGFMGAGKTTLASSLARRLDCPMVDLDQFIREREGRSPQQIIDEDGEARFRELETSALRAVLENEASCIIALGGGAWAFKQNRTLIAERDGFTVWLDAPFELCWRRIRSEGDKRPLARDREKAGRLYDERRALYGLADLRVQATEERSAEDVAAEIEHALLHRRTKL
ncbi:MAG TPA: shikimate kinase [Pyrinomonadaceae bacterium]|jgi:shikimate kinase